jgi:hypothetical protein
MAQHVYRDIRFLRAGYGFHGTLTMPADGNAGAIELDHVITG